ncbi:uncharacterized protein MICPUCDRAFT_49949 [Micromonas pusilla CCMP1545]|jgi:hypothetical protein|uniref:Predicted protein n=1 Tax=Micromonas pusilla (strain CCMP1545) TaxID=564608 RepID=C1MGV1_MICPC|nr:uncharacterized protein MICPUCDRAFT_49949 [Micromonas pusilla CCMP1545]EEH60635.1 predicted protein [Micromonas pusilla CCMP1545]|tara:strand:- start:895 stop:1194 length:300 start_codon:yes stop_codon:yes gene_type:complete|eukprot:XP_003055383.1 predicted protein [Micromonas pusilla CCMP1545]
MVRWLSPQFENREIDASAYANVTSEWMVGCVAPHVEDYMTNIPVPTFVGLQQCEFDGYFDAYPELRAFDFSSVDSMDFIRAMPPGMLMRIMSGTVDARS